MSFKLLFFDPEVEALLREIASDPRSKLLRFDRPRLLRGLFPRHPVGGRAPGLGKAERHLLDVHRVELAWALRQACLVKFLGERGFGRWIGRNVDLTHGYRVPSAARWRRLFRDELERGGSASWQQGCSPLHVESDWLSDSISHLASMSLQLESTDQARIYLAIDLALMGRNASSKRVLKEVLAGKATDEIASHALQALALCSSADRAYGEAAGLARRSARMGAERPEPYLNWLYYSLLSCDRAAAVECSDRISDLMDSRHPAVELFEKQLRTQRRSGEWSPSARTRGCVRRIDDQLGEPARRIARVLQ
jgi:hypothetical protein